MEFFLQYISKFINNIQQEMKMGMMKQFFSSFLTDKHYLKPYLEL